MQQSESAAKSTLSGRMLQRPDFKQEKSAEFFKSTRVNSCSYVKMKKGNAEAVPFYSVANPHPIENDVKSTYTQSYSHETFKVRPNLHVGSGQKLLEPYNPVAFRSRLPVEDAPVLTKNASQIEIGERNYFKFQREKALLEYSLECIRKLREIWKCDKPRHLVGENQVAPSSIRKMINDINASQQQLYIKMDNSPVKQNEIQLGQKNKENFGRIDHFNVPIVKGKKQHRIVFRDLTQKGGTLQDVYLVESYKEYNVDDESGHRKSSPSEGCNCIFF